MTLLSFTDSVTIEAKTEGNYTSLSFAVQSSLQTYTL